MTESRDAQGREGVGQHPRCETCAHWRKPQEPAPFTCIWPYVGTEAMGTCRRTPQRWDAIRWRAASKTFGLVGAYEDRTALVSDWTNYKAVLSTASSHYCPMHSALATPRSGDGGEG